MLRSILAAVQEVLVAGEPIEMRLERGLVHRLGETVVNLVALISAISLLPRRAFSSIFLRDLPG